MNDYLRILMRPNAETDTSELANGELSDDVRKLIVLETRFDTILPTLVTTVDLMELRIAFKAEISQLRDEFTGSHEPITCRNAEVTGYPVRIVSATMLRCCAPAEPVIALRTRTPV